MTNGGGLMAVPNAICDLVDRFERNREAYRSSSYNETQLRREFLDPFFEALGWDVNNRNGYAEAYKDVIHEDAVKVGGATKAPDYSFRIGGTRKFFVEAKKPSVHIKEDPAPAFQVRRYAWSAKLPLSIVTDFEEFAVYDCRIKPDKADKTSTGRTVYLTYNQYPEKWDDIAAVFSREAILRGSFDKYAESHKSKKGTAEVDDAFLAEIEKWRDLLARNIALRNPSLSTRELNFSVQRTIDRLIFLRICEDRGIEDYGALRSLINGANVYPRLRELYYKADARYNSGLFHFRVEKDVAESPDKLTLDLVIDDKPLKEILRHLYYPDSPYEFAVLPSDILGQVYEQFLGKVIRLTAGHQAVVEDKPEVKKAGGVFYTPTYIVEYIVKNTVGKLLDGKTPKQAEKLKILDPACGSGSFLLGAYQYLLDWHLNWYTENEPTKWAKAKQPVIYQGSGGEWRLTTASRKRVLLNNIYGVDIDSQAVEVTKLSLLLKVLEGETGESINKQLSLFHERALPDLSSNIKCGNSLVGPDFYDQKQLSFIDEEERYRVNIFDWQAEFAEIFKAGGFDAVIGNPPYVRAESLVEMKGYLQSHFTSYDSGADLYAFFMEKGVRLLRDNGLFGIIVSSSFLRTRFAAPIRTWLKKNATVERIVDFGGLPVFANAKDTYVCIPLLRKAALGETVEVCNVTNLALPDLEAYVSANSYTIPAGRLAVEAWSLKDDRETTVFAKVLTKGVPLGQYVEKKMFYGVKTGLNEAFELSSAEQATIYSAEPQSRGFIHTLLGGQDIRRYRLDGKNRHVVVIPSGWTRQVLSSTAAADEQSAWKWFKAHHPILAGRLEPFAESARKRQDKGDFWWELRSCSYYEYFEKPKIIFPDITKAPRFFLDSDGYYLTNTAYCLGIDDLYLLGILNSRLFWFAISHISIPFGIRAGQYRYRLIYQYMEKVPIRPIDFSDPTDKSRHDRMVQLAEQMLSLHKQLTETRTGHDTTYIQRQIDTTDRQIDRLVYELYGLSEEDIAIVEGM
jgi:hypothetical protein